MAATTTLPIAAGPFPIFKLAHKYLVYDADTISYIRREYKICGVLIGSLPQAPQQNVFLGLPMELMPEEARFLVEKEVAYVVDDVSTHKKAFLENGLGLEERKAYQAALRKQGLAAAKSRSQRGDEKKKAALARKAEAGDWNDIPEDMLWSARDRKRDPTTERAESNDKDSFGVDGETLFAAPEPSTTSRPSSSLCKAMRIADPEPFLVTPSTSYPPLHSVGPTSNDISSVTEALPSYPLYKHLHDQGYFLSPGLRFGCQLVAYPGDPLRFHSHFLCNGMDWDQEFDLLDLVGGGRLGTGVKKGFLIGGDSGDGNTAHTREEDAGGEVRSFCIEWGGM
jgi:tRNA-splicing endonuclease subunit Sen34